MINKDKIIAARVAARLGDSEDPLECNYEDFCRGYEGPKPLMHRKWLEYEITNKPTEEKVRLAKHHTTKIHNDMKGMLGKAPPNGKSGFWQNDRAVCGGIENYPDQILNRLAPVFAALDSLDPNHQVRKVFESATSEFKDQVTKVHNQFPSGKGMYKNRLNDLTPIGQKYLRDCIDITGSLIKGGSLSNYK